jgi:hypothetical protein
MDTRRFSASIVIVIFLGHFIIIIIIISSMLFKFGSRGDGLSFQCVVHVIVNAGSAASDENVGEKNPDGLCAVAEGLVDPTADGAEKVARGFAIIVIVSSVIVSIIVAGAEVLYDHIRVKHPPHSG